MLDRDTTMYLMELALRNTKVLHERNGLTRQEQRLVECRIETLAEVVGDVGAITLEQRLLKELHALKTMEIV